MTSSGSLIAYALKRSFASSVNSPFSFAKPLFCNGSWLTFVVISLLLRAASIIAITSELTHLKLSFQASIASIFDSTRASTSATILPLYVSSIFAGIGKRTSPARLSSSTASELSFSTLILLSSLLCNASNTFAASFLMTILSLLCF